MIGSLEKIEKKIRDNGQAEIAAIETETEEKISAIKAEIDEQAQAAYNHVKSARKKEVELIPRRIISDAKLEKKKSVDAKKTEIIDAAFEGAKAKILKMSKDERAKVMASLAESAKKDLPDATIYADKKYADLLSEAKSSDIGDFGIVAKNKDATIVVDNTLESIMKRLQVNLKPQLVKMLFKGE